MDGPRSITDMTRKAENGMGAYPMIIHAMELLKKHDYIPSLSVTISEDVLRNQATVIDWLQEMHLSFGIKDISYNLWRISNPDLFQLPLSHPQMLHLSNQNPPLLLMF